MQTEPLDEQTIIVRGMMHSDVDSSARIACEAGNGSHEDWSLRFGRDIENEKHFPVVAVNAKNLIVGYARTCWHEGDSTNEKSAPTGWYLMGLRVEADERRRGFGKRLTNARLDWIVERAAVAYYFTSTHNKASQELHDEMGFESLGSDFTFPGLEPDHGEVLFSVHFRRNGVRN